MYSLGCFCDQKYFYMLLIYILCFNLYLCNVVIQNKGVKLQLRHQMCNLIKALRLVVIIKKNNLNISYLKSPLFFFISIQQHLCLLIHLPYFQLQWRHIKFNSLQVKANSNSNSL